MIIITLIKLFVKINYLFFVAGSFQCDCGLRYQHRTSLYKHKKYECGKEPQFQCPHCPHKSKLRGNLKTHIILKHSLLQ